MGIQIKPQFFQCDSCNHYHSTGWYGDCRDDDNRFTAGFLDKQYGPDGWTEVDPKELEALMHNLDRVIRK